MLVFFQRGLFCHAKPRFDETGVGQHGFVDAGIAHFVAKGNQLARVSAIHAIEMLPEGLRVALEVQNQFVVQAGKAVEMRVERGAADARLARHFGNGYVGQRLAFEHDEQSLLDVILCACEDAFGSVLR